MSYTGDKCATIFQWCVMSVLTLCLAFAAACAGLWFLHMAGLI